MTTESLSYVNNLLTSLNIPYEFGTWSSKVPDTYWTGEYTEIETVDEDRCEESMFILTGNTVESKLILETTKEIIKNKLQDGLTAILDSGSAIAVIYSVSNPIPSIDPTVSRLEIRLRIKEWRC